MSFAFAKIWAADKEDMVEVNDAEQDDSWAQALEKINAEREKMREAEIERGGRGQRRAAAMAKPTYYVEDTPTKAKGKGKATSSMTLVRPMRELSTNGECFDSLMRAILGMPRIGLDRSAVK